MQPINQKIYHILHFNKLQSIINSGGLLSDAEVIRQGLGGTTIGMNSIKQRRLTELTLETHPSLYVGQCVPFYFCPRSVMLYMMSKNTINTNYWMEHQDTKQAEFLYEDNFPWDLVEK